MRAERMTVEQVLSSKGRIKILKILAEAGELNISEIAKRAKLNHTTTLAHLLDLKKAGLVEEKTFGRIRIFRLREEDPRTKALKHLFEVFEKYSGEEHESGEA